MGMTSEAVSVEKIKKAPQPEWLRSFLFVLELKGVRGVGTRFPCHS